MASGRRPKVESRVTAPEVPRINSAPRLKTIRSNSSNVQKISLMPRLGKSGASASFVASAISRLSRGSAKVMTAMRIGSVPGTGMTPASGGTFKSAAEWSSETTAPVPLSSAGISTDTAAARTEQAKRSSPSSTSSARNSGHTVQGGNTVNPSSRSPTRKSVCGYFFRIRGFTRLSRKFIQPFLPSNGLSVLWGI